MVDSSDFGSVNDDASNKMKEISANAIQAKLTTAGAYVRASGGKNRSVDRNLKE